MNVLGLQSVPPDVFYNPSRVLWVGMDAVEGVYIYFMEDWGREGKMIEDYFNRLIEQKIDPIITFKVLNLGQQTMSVIRLFFAFVDPVEIVGEIIKEINPEAGELYSAGVNKTGAVLKEGAKVIGQSNATSVMAHVIATLVPVLYETPGLIYKASKFYKPARYNDNSTEHESDYGYDANITRSDVILADDRAMSNAQFVVSFHSKDAVPFTLPSATGARSLLGLECFLLVSLKDRLMDVGAVIIEYYGSSDGYLKDSMCGYEKFLVDPFFADTEESGDACPREGQTKFRSTFSTLTKIPGLAQASDVLISQGIGIVGTMEEFFAKPRDVMIRDMVAFVSNWDTSSITCDTDCLMCKKKKRSLLSSIWIVESWLFIFLGALALVGIPIFASFFTAQFAIAPVMTLYLTYGFPITCLPFVPVCLGDDMFDLLLLIFPRHLTWPPNIVTDATRETSSEFLWLQTLSAEMVDCSTVGIDGFFDVFYWSRHYFAESGYIVYDWFWQLIEWPLLRFAPGIQETREHWRGADLTPTVNECAALNGISIVPPLILSGFFYTIVSFAAVPMTRVSVHVFSQLLPLVTSFISLALDIYNK